MRTVTVRPQQPVQVSEWSQRVHMPARLRGRAARLPARMHRQLRVPTEQGVREPEVHGPVRRHLRHQRPLPGRQPQPHLQLLAQLHRRSIRQMHQGRE